MSAANNISDLLLVFLYGSVLNWSISLFPLFSRRSHQQSVAPSFFHIQAYDILTCSKNLSHWQSVFMTFDGTFIKFLTPIYLLALVLLSLILHLHRGLLQVVLQCTLCIILALT